MSSVLLNNFVSEWNRLTVEFENLQSESPFWFESSREYRKIFQVVAATAVFCTSIWFLSLQIYGRYFSTKETPAWKRTKTCYQVTNLCFNLSIGLLGVYQHYWVLPTLPAYNATNSVEQIPHLFDEFYLMPAMQLGYQAWSIPIGTLYANESKQMVLHHCGVIFAASCGAFSHFGFRYWLPFFFGLFELSSVPLAIMNIFKEHPDAAKKHPLLNHTSRVFFVVSFLYIRVWKWLPVGPLYMRNNFFLFLTTDFGATKFFLLLQFLFGVYLGYLQLFWAVMVVKLSFRAVAGKKKKA
jgi:hypothetical protein